MPVKKLMFALFAFLCLLLMEAGFQVIAAEEKPAPDSSAIASIPEFRYGEWTVETDKGGVFEISAAVLILPKGEWKGLISLGRGVRAQEMSGGVVLSPDETYVLEGILKTGSAYGEKILFTLKKVSDTKLVGFAKGPRGKRATTFIKKDEVSIKK